MHISASDYIPSGVSNDPVRQLRYDYEALQEKYENLQKTSNYNFCKAYEHAHEAQRFERLFKKHKKLFVLFLVLSLILFNFCVYLIVNFSSRNSGSSLDYTSGYTDALSGIKPPIERVACILCGYHSSEHNAEHLTLFKTNGSYVPICNDCIEKHTLDPVIILGEEYVFSSAVAD